MIVVFCIVCFLVGMVSYRAGHMKGCTDTAMVMARVYRTRLELFEETRKDYQEGRIDTTEQEEVVNYEQKTPYEDPPWSGLAVSSLLGSVGDSFFSGFGERRTEETENIQPVPNDSHPDGVECCVRRDEVCAREPQDSFSETCRETCSNYEGTDSTPGSDCSSSCFDSGSCSDVSSSGSES